MSDEKIIFPDLKGVFYNIRVDPTTGEEFVEVEMPDPDEFRLFEELLAGLDDIYLPEETCLPRHPTGPAPGR